MSMKLPLCNLSFKSFTLIELLIVIVIIGILTTSLIPKITGVQVQARNTKRIADMRTIQTALEMYHQQYGYLPRTIAYGESNAGGRDYSSQSGFLIFLQTADILDKVPVDPINNASDDSGQGYSYSYFCYHVSGTTSMRRYHEAPVGVIRTKLEKGFRLPRRTRISSDGLTERTYLVVPVDNCSL